MEIPYVRFDDLSPGGAGSFGLLEPAGSMVARRLDDVVPALEEAEDAARDGLWVAGYVSYEAAPAFNQVLAVRPSGLHDPMRELPLASFQAFRKRVELDEIDSPQLITGDYHVSGWTADSTQHDYREDLASIGRALMAGEVTRLTHTFRLRAAFSGDPPALYRDLLLSQRGPHGVCLDVDRFRLVSASPTGFFRRAGNRITVRPVLASIRRGRWLEEDLRMMNQLRTEGEQSYTNRLVVKEIQTELAEIGDLVSRSSVDEFTVERLETLWHLTTEVTAALRPDTGLIDIFSALFPTVSVTGVPKAEAMELITATEDTPRGVYCGAIGFLAPSVGAGVDADFNVAVRTVVIDDEEGVAEFGVGTAITNRSDAVGAYEEARLKAKVLVDRRPDFMLQEEVRCEGGVPLYREETLARLGASAEYFGYAMDAATFLVELQAAAETTKGDNALTLALDREGTIVTDVVPAPPWHEGPGSPELLVGALASEAVSSENIYLFHNTTNCRVADAMALRYPDADVVIVCNERGEVAGAVKGNVVVFIGDRWVTPAIGCATWPTVYRDRLVAQNDIDEAVISRDELRTATDVGVLDDIHGWRAVALVETGRR